MNKILKSKYLKNQYGDSFIFHINNLLKQIVQKTHHFFDVSDDEIEFVALYKYAELKSNLATENEGSSKKIIDDLLNAKIEPKNDNEQMIVNLNAVYQYLDSAKPNISLKNIKTVYSILETNIEMGANKLDQFPRQHEGEVHNYKTPSPKSLPNALDTLIQFINSDELVDNPLLKAHAIHICWIYYHPTYDFNGRVGRILAYWYLILHLDKGWYFIAQSISSSLVLVRKKYIKLWDEVRKKKDDVKLISILLDFVQKVNGSYCIILLKIIVFLEKKKLEKQKIHLTPIQMMILTTLAVYNKQVNVMEIEKLIDSGLSKAGIHKAVTQLVDLKLLKSTQSGRNVIYAVNIERMGITVKDLNNINNLWHDISKIVW